MPTDPRPLDPRVAKFIGVDVTEQPKDDGGDGGTTAALFADETQAHAWAAGDTDRTLFAVHRATISGPFTVTARIAYDTVLADNAVANGEG
jgi:hypothetical protein